MASTDPVALMMSAMMSRLRGGKFPAGPVASLVEACGIAAVIEKDLEAAECGCDLSVGFICHRCAELALHTRLRRLLIGATSVLLAEHEKGDEDATNQA